MELMEDARNYARLVMQKFKVESKTRTFERILLLMKLFRKRLIDSKTFSSALHAIFTGDSDLIEGFHKFLPKDHQCTASIAPGKTVSPKEIKFGRHCPSKEEWQECINFVNLGRKTLENDEKYGEFLQAITNYKAHKDLDQMDKDLFNICQQNPEVHIELSRVFADAIEAMSVNKEDTIDSDLIDGFHEVLPMDQQCIASIALGRTATPKKIKFGRRRPSKEELQECINFVNLGRKTLRNDKKYQEFLQAIANYKVHKDFDRMDKDVFNICQENPELHVELSGVLAGAIEEMSVNKADLIENKEKNDYYYAKKRRYADQEKEMNPSQQALFDCEDEMFYADMTFHHFESTREAAIRCLEKREEIESNKHGAEEFYKDIHLRLIKRLYTGSGDEDGDSDYGELILEQLLHHQPIRASELILKQLNRKLEELEALRHQVKDRCRKKMKIYHERAPNYGELGTN